MMSWSVSSVDGDSWADNPRGSFRQDFHHLGQTFVTSPEQPPTALPDSNPSFSYTQRLPIYAPTHKAPPSPNSRALFDPHGRPHQTDNQSNQYHTHFGPVPTTPQSYATLNVGSSFQGYPSPVASASNPICASLVDAGYQLVQIVNDPFSVYNTLDYSQDHSTYAHSLYNGSQASVDQSWPYHSATGIPYQQFQSSSANVVRSPSDAPPNLPFHPTVSRSPPAQVPPIHRNSQGNHSITGSPYPPIRTTSLPVQSTPHQEVMVGTCKWMKDDGTVCGAQITPATVPDHLATHGIKKMTGGFRLQCRWLECRLRGDRKVMNRESIVRHVREKHLGRKRTL